MFSRNFKIAALTMTIVISIAVTTGCNKSDGNKPATLADQQAALKGGKVSADDFKKWQASHPNMQFGVPPDQSIPKPPGQ